MIHAQSIIFGAARNFKRVICTKHTGWENCSLRHGAPGARGLKLEILIQF